jgi:hypothetical protein
MWCYLYDPQTKWQSSYLKVPDFAKEADFLCSQIKGQGDVGSLLQIVLGHTVSKTLYTDILCCLRDTIHWKHLELWQAGNWVLHHNSLPTHRSDLIYKYMSKHDVTMLSQPPNSPSLAHTDCYLYLRLKGFLNRCQFARSDDEVATAAVPNKVIKNGLQDCF